MIVNITTNDKLKCTPLKLLCVFSKWQNAALNFKNSRNSWVGTIGMAVRPAPLFHWYAYSQVPSPLFRVNSNRGISTDAKTLSTQGETGKEKQFDEIDRVKLRTRRASSSAEKQNLA